MWSTAGRFGSYLRELREARRLTLDDVERITRDAPEPVTRSLLSRLENGRARVSALKLLALARSYRIKLSILAEKLEHLHSETQAASLDDGAVQLCRRVQDQIDSGNLESARSLFDRIESSPEAGASEVQALRLTLARRLLEESRPRAARQLLEAALSMAPDDPSALPLLLLLAQTARALGQPLLARSAVLAIREHPRPWPAQFAYEASAVEAIEYVEAGSPDDAIGVWLKLLDAARRASDRRSTARAALELGRLSRSVRQHSSALDWLEQARSDAALIEDRVALTLVWLEIGHVESQRRRPALARRAYHQARQIGAEIQRHDLSFAAYLRLWRLARLEGDATDERASLRALRSLSRSMQEIPLDATDLLPHLPRSQSASARSSVNG